VGVGAGVGVGVGVGVGAGVGVGVGVGVGAGVGVGVGVGAGVEFTPPALPPPQAPSDAHRATIETLIPNLRNFTRLPPRSDCHTWEKSHAVFRLLSGYLADKRKSLQNGCFPKVEHYCPDRAFTARMTNHRWKYLFGLG